MNWEWAKMVVGILKLRREKQQAEKISHFLFGRKN
jgi:hypothetical protein